MVGFLEDRPKPAEAFTPSAGELSPLRKADPPSAPAVPVMANTVSTQHDQSARELLSVLIATQQPGVRWSSTQGRASGRLRAGHRRRRHIHGGAPRCKFTCRPHRLHWPVPDHPHGPGDQPHPKLFEAPSSTPTLTHQPQTTAHRGWLPRRCRGAEPLKTDEDTCTSLATSQQSWQRSSSLA